MAGPDEARQRDEGDGLSKVYRDHGLRGASDLDKTLIALNLAIFAGGTALLGSATTGSWDGGCFLLAMACSAFSIFAGVIHAQTLSKVLIAWGAKLAGEASLPGPFGDPIPTADRLGGLTALLKRAYGSAITSLLFATLFGTAGVIIHSWAAVVGAGKAWLAYGGLVLALLLAFGAGTSLGRRRERRRRP